MFTAEFKEAAESKVCITDSSTLVFEEFLRFMYTGEVNGLEIHVVDLLALLHKYEVESLNKECEAQLLKGLDAMNAYDVFQYAHLYNCSLELKQAAFSFIKR
jgi:BTB/POZ domain